MSGRRLVGVVALRDGEDEPVALERRLDGAQRARPSGRDRRGQPREDHRPPQRENRQCLANAHLKVLAACCAQCRDEGDPFTAGVHALTYGSLHSGRSTG